MFIVIKEKVYKAFTIMVLKLESMFKVFQIWGTVYEPRWMIREIGWCATRETTLILVVIVIP